MITGRPEGSNITFMNSYNTRRYNGGKPTEILAVIYKDVDTGQKYKEEFVDPDFMYYMVKPEHRTSYNRLFVPEEHVTEHHTKHLDLEKDIAKNLGMTKWFYENIQSGNRRENKRVHMHPDIFDSDGNIEDQYRSRFGRKYKNNICSITKSYFDIEVDGINMAGDFPEMGECPINAITIIFQEINQVYTFLLRDKNNPQMIQFESEVTDGSIFGELKEFIINAVGGQKVAEGYGVDKLNFNFLFYDEENEINLIKDLFNALNNFKPDFLLAWNMAFDIPYIIGRIKTLGYNPEDIICHPDFDNKFVDYLVDERNKNELAERGDFAIISSYTVFLDQMIQFASRRKGQTKFLSYSLDFIGEKIAKVKKLDYKHITTNIAELPRKNYKVFAFYNIMDTIVQFCIEAMTGDLEYVFGKCNVNNTRYSKCHRQTVYLANRGVKEFYADGLIMGNNSNRYNEKPEEKFSGAYVADMSRINNHSRKRIYGRPVNIFDFLIDMDYTALYPSLIRQFNIASNTQIGKVFINEQVHDKENRINSSKWDRAGQFMEDIQSQVWLEFCTRWLHLPDYLTLHRSVNEFLQMTRGNTYYLTPREGKEYSPVIFYNSTEGGIYCPVDFMNTFGDICIPSMDITRMREWRTNAIENPNQQFRSASY